MVMVITDNTATTSEEIPDARYSQKSKIFFIIFLFATPLIQADTRDLLVIFFYFASHFIINR